MRILFVASSMGYGGAERVISLISNELCARGHEVGIYLTSANSKCVYELDERITVYSERLYKIITNRFLRKIFAGMKTKSMKQKTDLMHFA